MTVKELLEVAWCDGVEIIIRENGDGKWIYAYKIGKEVQVGKYDYINGKQSGRFFKPEKAVEVCRYDGNCRMLIIPKDVKKLPKEVKDLKVAMFRESYIGPNIEHGFEINCFPKGFIPPLEMLRSDQAKLNTEQLSLFDTNNNETEEIDE